jgi:hypothetical protein
MGVLRGEHVPQIEMTAVIILRLGTSAQRSIRNATIADVARGAA